MTKAKHNVIKWPTTVMPTFALGELDWQEHSICQWQDPSLFDEFHSRAKTSDWDRVEEAQRVCAGCPVRTECLAFGVSDQQSGVWGGHYLSQGHVIPPGSRVCKERHAA